MARGSLTSRLILTNTVIVAVLLVGGGYLMQTASRNASMRLLDRSLMTRAQEIAMGPFPGLEMPLGPGPAQGNAQVPGAIQEPGNPLWPQPEQSQTPRGGGQQQGRGMGQRPGFSRMPGFGGGRGPRGMDFGRPVWLDLSGKVVAPPGRTVPWSVELSAESAKGKRSIATVPSNEGPLRAASVPVVRKGKAIGVVQVVQPMEGLQVSMTASRQVFLWVVPFGLLASGLVGWLVLRNSLAPVERATKTAEKIAETGRLDERLPVTGTDEMSKLSEAFNLMFEKLSVSQSAKDEAMTRLAAALEEQKRFTADASHELRTPLASLRLSIEGLKESAAFPQEPRKQLDLMDGVSRGMARLVDDLLILARADSGNLSLSKEHLDLKKPLAEALLVHGLGDSETLQVAFPEGALMGVCDEDAVRRIAVNLLANAKRHCPDGALTLGGKVDGPWAVFWVKDSGEGMSQEEADQAGTRFYRADAARDRDKGGHGLGLAICRSLAEAMGGGMKIISEKGSGALVQVWVPAGQPGQTAEVQSQSS